MPAGRPTVYDPEYHPAKAYEFCAEDGFTDKKLGRVFDVSEQTINTWKKEHTKFLESIRAGKDEYDSNAVEKSLRRRAVGFSFTETTMETTGDVNDKGKPILAVTKKVKKYVPPDTQANRLWLINRRPARWRDKQDIDLTGDLNINLIDSFAEEGTDE